MKRYALTTAAVLLTVACSGGSEPAAQMPGLAAEDDAAIRALITEWDRMVSAGNLVETASLMTDDYVEARPVALVGPQAARAMYEGFPLTYTAATTTIKKLEGVGDLAWAWLDFQARYTRNSGERMAQTGNSVWVLKKGEDGHWKIAASGFQAASRPDSAAAN